MEKNPPANAGDVGLIPALGRSPGEKNGYPLQYSYLENPILQVDFLLYEPPGKPKNTGMGCHDLPPGNLPNPGIQPRSLALQADYWLSHQGSQWKTKYQKIELKKNEKWLF